MSQRIGFDRYSLMALIEVTSKTALLQHKIQTALHDSAAGVEFVMDVESVQDTRQKVLDSYERALNSLDKAARVAMKTNRTEISDLFILSVKCLAEHAPNGEIFRWSDTLNVHLDKHDFFAQVKHAIGIKKEAYLSTLSITDGMLTVKPDAIQPYWITESELLPLNVQINVVENNRSWPDYLKELEELLKRLRRNRKPPRKSLLKMKNIYHLHSLYDAGIDELWLCQQGFATGYLKYLSSEPTFAQIVKNVKLERLKPVRDMDERVKSDGL